MLLRRRHDLEGRAFHAPEFFVEVGDPRVGGYGDRPLDPVVGHDMHRPMPDPRYIRAITTNPALDTSFIMMESFRISMTLKKR